MQLTVRPVLSSDWAAVVRIENRLTNPWDKRDHREFERQERNVTYVADGDGHLFGFVCATVMPTHVLVERVAVDHAYRRVRVGTGLLDSLEHFFVTARRKQMQAVVNEWAVDQQLFLRACGWRWVKTVRWGCEPEEYVMVKEFK